MNIRRKLAATAMAGAALTAGTLPMAAPAHASSGAPVQWWGHCEYHDVVIYDYGNGSNCYTWGGGYNVGWANIPGTSSVCSDSNRYGYIQDTTGRQFPFSAYSCTLIQDLNVTTRYIIFTGPY